MSKTMRVAICDRPGHIELRRRPIPNVGDDQILVRVLGCGVCGSDLAVWRGTFSKTYPYSPGHEFCGIVETIGRSTSGFQLGQRVVINPNLGCGRCRFCRDDRPNLCDALKTRPIKSNGGFSDYVALDHRMAHPLGDELDDTLAVFVEPLSCAVHAACRAQVRPGEHVAIWGAGTIGILTGIAAKSVACELTFVEPVDVRRRQVAELFAAEVLTPEQAAESNLAGRLDVAIDCSGRVEAVCQAIKLLRKAGRLVLAGLVTHADQAGLPLIDVVAKELEITGIWLNPNTFDEAIRLAIEHKNMLRSLNTERFALDDVISAFERATDQDVNKVVVRP